MGDGVQLALGVTLQVGAPWEVLAKQPLGVFVGAALPQAVRKREEDPGRELLSGAHAQWSLCLDHRSACCAVVRARTGVFL
jgi:hypothetical protein